MGYTLWQYVLEYVYLAYHNSHANTATLNAGWPSVFWLLLKYGADPFARCIGDYNIWTRAFDSIERKEWSTQASTWGFYADIQQQDATSVIKTMFRNMESKDMVRLIAMLEDKKVGQISLRQNGH
jgi:hypothetical protein